MDKDAQRALNVRGVTTGGVIAALYAALTLLFAFISLGEVQFRLSEALTLLPVITPHAVPGLFLGCLMSNLLLGAPWQDVVFGSLATLLAAVLTRWFRRNLWLAAAMPVVVNGLVVGMMLHAVYNLPTLPAMLTVALGEAAVCFLLGVPLTRLVEKRLAAGAS